MNSDAPITPTPIPSPSTGLSLVTPPRSTRRRRCFGRPTVVVALATLLPIACGDDANDHELRTQRAAELAADFRAGQTTVVATEPSTDGDLDAAADDGVEGAVADTVETAPAVEPTGVVVPVVALDNSFRPEVIEIAVGDEIVWENRGLNEHNVLRVEGEGWGVEVDGFQPGDVYPHVFTEPGEYRYFCSIHGNEDVGMIGTVVVAG